jgi:hypothetical protein
VSNPIRAVIVAATIILIALAFAPSPPSGGDFVVSGPHSVKVPDQPEYGVTGVGLAVRNAGAWYTAASKVDKKPDKTGPTIASSQVRGREQVDTHGCQYADLIRSVWSQDAEWAIGIAWRESNCTAGASNPSGAHGLFQMLGHHDIFVAIGCEDEFNPECNARAAWSLYQGSGRRPWAL